MVPKSLRERIGGNSLEHHLQPQEIEDVLNDLFTAKLVTAVEKEVVVDGSRHKAVEIRIMLKL